MGSPLKQEIIWISLIVWVVVVKVKFHSLDGQNICCLQIFISPHRERSPRAIYVAYWIEIQTSVPHICSRQIHAAVNVEDVAGDVAGFIAGEKNDGGGDITR